MSKRNVGIDLLRIVSMFMIVNLHVIGHGGLAGTVQQITGEYVVVWSWETLMYCSVNCYAIISGFVSYGKTQKWKNVIDLWVQTFFYSVAIMGVMVLIGATNGVGLKDLFKYLFPLSTERYWYFNAYVGTFLFAPLLSRAVEVMDKKAMGIALTVIILVLGFPTTIFYSDPFHIEYGCSAIWLMVLFIVGAYIKKYGTENIPRKNFLIGFFVSVLVTCVVKFGALFVAGQVGVSLSNSYMNTNLTPTIVTAAICLFCCFKDLDIKSEKAKKVCVYIGSLTYGIFLFHVHPLMISKTLLGKFVWILDKPLYAIIPLVIGCSVIIFVVSALVETARKTAFGLLRIDRFGQFAEKQCLKLYQTVEKKFNI